MRKILFLLFFAFSTAGFSFIWPSLLKKIERCELFYNTKRIFPGSEFEVYVVTTLKDGSEIHSIEGGSVSFADYIFELSGAARVIKKNRKKLTIQIAEKAYEHPTINLSIKLRRKKSVSWSKKIPINFEILQQVAFHGKNGYDPRANTQNGYRTIPLAEGINIQFIDNEQTLTNNSDPNIIGGSGPDLNVYVSLIESSTHEKIVEILIEHEDGSVYKKYLKPNIGGLEISTSGGKGGISKSGGRGGKGGDVNVFITPEAKPYFKQIYIYNFGGEGGDLWRPKVDGQQHGAYGDDGKLTISVWDGTQLEK